MARRSSPPAPAPPPDPRTIVVAYHQTTKHGPGRYARALGYMDWDTQPDPFRRYEGAPLLPLDLTGGEGGPAYDEALRVGAVAPPAALDRRALSQLLEDSLALSAWKQHRESRWSLRVNPSSGNLHPTEGYVVTGPVPGLLTGAGVLHYAPREHALELRRSFEPALLARLAPWLPEGGLLLGLSSIHWRESWKYGERAYRYCQHDVGHAIGAVAISAACLGWDARLLCSVADPELARLLGIAGQEGPEAEHPDALIALFPAGLRLETWASLALDRPALDEIAGGSWSGTPNVLSKDHHEWPVIDVVAEAARLRTPPAAELWWAGDLPAVAGPPAPPVPARRIVRQRRSAVDMDGRTAISREAFYRMMAAVMPSAGRVPFQLFPWRPAIHLALFVHRVDDLEPGLYLLARRADALPELRAAMTPTFAFARPDGCPAGLPLVFLRPGDMRGAAAGVSCGQDIAADGAFALGMIAELEPTLERNGPWFYRALHWEAGAVGQVLYLEAEAAGIRATGIGCFFDDSMHGVLGLSDLRLHTIYHFTVGAPVEDGRLQTAPPYDRSPAITGAAPSR